MAFEELFSELPFFRVAFPCFRRFRNGCKQMRKTFFLVHILFSTVPVSCWCTILIVLMDISLWFILNMLCFLNNLFLNSTVLHSDMEMEVCCLFCFPLKRNRNEKKEGKMQMKFHYRHMLYNHMMMEGAGEGVKS